MYSSRSSYNTPPSRRNFGTPARGSAVSGLRSVRASPSSPGTVPTPSASEPSFRTTGPTSKTTLSGNSPGGKVFGAGSTSKSQQHPQISSLSSPLFDAKSPMKTTSPVGVRRPVGGTATAPTYGSTSAGRYGNNHTNMSLDTAVLGGAVSNNTRLASTHLISSIEDTYRVMKKLVPDQGGAVPKTYVTIVFDLDETLCNNRRAGKALLRPGTLDLLNSLRAASSALVYVEIILWTASMECVAKPVVDRLDPHGNIFDHLIYRDRRWYKETGYTKDLRKLGRSMDRVIIMENSPLSVTLNRRNAILVKDFVGGYTNQNDQELAVSKEILITWISEVKDEVEKILVGAGKSSPSSVNVSQSSSGTSFSCGLSTGGSTQSLSSLSGHGTPQPPSDSPKPNPRSNFLTPKKMVGAEVDDLSEQYLAAGPRLTDFLQQHPNISSGNEMVVKPSQQSCNAVLSSIAMSHTGGARSSPESSPNRRFPSPSSRSPAIGSSPYGSSRRPLYAR